MSQPNGSVDRSEAAPLTRREAAAYLGISWKSLRRLEALGEVAFLDYPSGGRRFEVADLDAFKARCRKRCVPSESTRKAEIPTSALVELARRHAVQKLELERLRGVR